MYKGIGASAGIGIGKIVKIKEEELNYTDVYKRQHYSSYSCPDRAGCFLRIWIYQPKNDSKRRNYIS